MFPELVQSLIDWYKWKAKMTISNYDYRSSLFSFHTAIYIYKRGVMKVPKIFNYRRINDPSHFEDLRYTRLLNKKCDVVAKLPKKYEYSNGS